MLWVHLFSFCRQLAVRLLWCGGPPGNGVLWVFEIMMVTMGLYTVHPLLLPKPGPNPSPHGPFKLVRRTKLPRLRHVILVVNPVSGNGQGKQIAENVCAPFFEGFGIEVSRYYTDAPGDAMDMLKHRPMSNLDAVVVVGGDGTIHEVCKNEARAEVLESI